MLIAFLIALEPGLTVISIALTVPERIIVPINIKPKNKTNLPNLNRPLFSFIELFAINISNPHKLFF